MQFNAVIVILPLEVITLHPDQPIKAALIPMIKHRIGRIVVTNQDKEICGVLSRKDIVNYFVNELLDSQ